MFAQYDKDDFTAFIHYSGSSTNPVLTNIVSASLIDYCKKSVIRNPGKDPQMIKSIITTN